MRDENLVVDLGFYKGDSSDRYLFNGYTVIGVDCNPKVNEVSRIKFKSFIETGKLTLLDLCIDKTDNLEKEFYISLTYEVWSSAQKKIAERKFPSAVILVKTITLSSIFEKYGIPIYCKIDIEGNDIIALNSLTGRSLEQLPKFISCETECLGDEDPTKYSGLEVIEKLHELGYNKFFIENQSVNNSPVFDFTNPNKYHWYDFNETCRLLLKARSDHNWDSGSWTFWWDVYATF